MTEDGVGGWGMLVEFRLITSEKIPGFEGKLVSVGKSPHK